MHIGLVIYGSLETVSGGYLYDRRLVEHLRRSGDEVEIISLPWRNYGRHLADNFSRTLARRLADPSLDVLLQDELNHPSLFLLNRDRFNRRPIAAPVVAIVHHLRSSEARPAWLNRFYRLVEGAYLRTADAFIYNSRATMEAVAAILPRRSAGPKPYLIAYPGGDRLAAAVSVEEIARRAGRGPLQVVFVGNLIPRKGLHVLLRAMALRPERDWRLTVVGRAADPAYARRVRATGDGRTRFVGAVGDEELADLLAHSHVLAVPSSYEGFGIVYLEGMGFGLPAIAGTAGATAEIIDSGANGFVIRPGDAQALAGRLAELDDDRDKLAAMGRAALARYQAHPTWEETASGIRAFLLSLAA